ncbi:MAG TPA: class I SAM-dependent methyltransferase [Chitinophagales bacterium]|nr:class I SAM-dependent methyltransferase [Chitinophagales bacterium]HRP38724.1 class I SAM-dependent methyltransferase [Chitinophagales bacterium]
MAEKEWFIDWFNSPYYHLLYKNHDETEAEKFVTAIAKELKIEPNTRILDVACGKGRHSKMFHQLGFDVTGIDLSKNSIDFAKQFEDEKLHFAQWDMRQTFHENYFNVAVNLFSSFGYLPTEEDNLTALKAIASNLKQNGILIIDYMNSEWVVKHLKAREILQLGAIQFHIKRKVSAGFVVKEIQFLDEAGSDNEYEEKLRIIPLQKFEELCSQSGLAIKNVWGNYELETFNSRTSPRIILHCEKL